MSYSADRTKVLVDQLRVFATHSRYQLVGQLAILDFWIGEVQHCLAMIDGNKARFERLKAAEKQYVAERETIRFDLDDPSSIQGAVVPTLRWPAKELRDARNELCDAAYRFLLRCYHEGVMDERSLRSTCDSLQLPVDATDLKHA
jgi:hypothetical protein